MPVEQRSKFCVPVPDNTLDITRVTKRGEIIRSPKTNPMRGLSSALHTTPIPIMMEIIVIMIVNFFILAERPRASDCGSEIRYENQK
jgi:hypothetical protein